MSKELKALERIRGIADRIAFNQKNKLGDVGYQWVKETILDNVNDLETALKENEELKKENLVLSVKEKALEIIKEHWTYNDKGLVQVKPISMEDANLLKEVLL